MNNYIEHPIIFHIVTNKSFKSFDESQTQTIRPFDTKEIEGIFS